MGQYLYLKGLNVNPVLLSVINYIHTDFKATFLGARHHARISLISYLILTIFQEVLLSHLKDKITKGQRDYIICSRSIVISSRSRHVALISTKIENSFYLKKKGTRHKKCLLYCFRLLSQTAGGTCSCDAGLWGCVMSSCILLVESVNFSYCFSLFTAGWSMYTYYICVIYIIEILYTLHIIYTIFYIHNIYFPGN